jgi:hypothetical protein
MGVIAKKMAAQKGPDPEDAKEPPEQPGEAPDAEDQQEGPEDQPEGAGESESPEEDAGEGGGEEGEGGPPPNVSPEEQAMYNTVVIAAQAIIYGQGSGDLVKQRVLASKGDPKELGHIAAMIVMSVQGGAKKEGKDIPTDVLFAAGQEVVADIVELAVAAKLVKPGDEEDVFKKTLFEGLRVYGNVQMATGQVSMADRHDAASQLLEIHRDDPNTKLGDLADKMMSGGGQGEPDQQQPPEEAQP